MSTNNGSAKSIVAEEPYDIYRPKERLIYQYWDGSKMVCADPMVLYKRMMAVGPELSIHIKVSQSTSKDAGKAHEALVVKTREIFSVKTLDENGLTEVEAIELLDHFLTYCEHVKKNSSAFLTSSTSSAPSESSGESPSTGNSSASGSTAEGPSTAEPEPSLTAPR